LLQNRRGDIGASFGFSATFGRMSILQGGKYFEVFRVEVVAFGVMRDGLFYD
jgi:hypothetical protein